MLIIIILAVCLATVGAKNTNTDIFKGEWTPVAYYPAVIYLQACLRVSFTKNQDVQCVCADRNRTELIDIIRVVDSANDEWDKTPFVIVKDGEDVTRAINVNCTCGDKEYSSRSVGRPVGENYYVVFKNQNVTDKEPNSAVIYAKEAPAYATMIDVMHNIEDLKDREGEVMCTSEYEYAEMLSKMKIHS